MKSIFNFILISLGIGFSSTIQASACSSAFGNVFQTHSSDPADFIRFNCGAQATGSSTFLDGLNVINPSSCGTPTCTSGDCTPSGTPANTIDAGGFQSSNLSDGNLVIGTGGSSTASVSSGWEGHFNTISVGRNATLTFTDYGRNTAYYINYLDIKSNATINLVPGDYWIADVQSGDMNKAVTFNVVGSGTARIYLGSDTTIRKDVNFNVAGQPNKILIYGYGDIDLEKDLNINAFIYSQQDVNVKINVIFNGAINAKSIDVEKDVVATYDPNAPSIDFDQLCPADDTPTYYTIEHDGEGVLCVDEAVSVTAKNSSGVTTAYVGMIELDTGSGKGTWSLSSGSGTLTDSTSNDGLATYTFSASDNGTATFNLNYTEGDSVLDIEVQEQGDGSVRDDDTEGTLTFATSGFVITDGAISSTYTGIPPAFSTTMTAGISDTMYVIAYGLQGGTSCGLITSYTGSQSLMFWQDYVDPGTGTKTFTIDGNSIASSESGASAQTVEFTAGIASITALYRDVGQVKVYAKDTAPTTESDGTITYTKGSTEAFVVKPAKFSVTVPDNPGASDATGSAFKKAGEYFTVQVEVQDNDGNATPNYGNESTPEGIRLYSSTLVAPTGGRNGTSDDGALTGTAFSKTSGATFESTNVTFDEVGIIKLTAGVSDSDYMGVGDVSGPESDNIGRFTPDHFAASGNTPAFAAGCVSGGFSYLGQSLFYTDNPVITVTAQNSNNVTTENYTGDFFKMSSTLVNPTYSSNVSSASLNATLAQLDVTVSDTGSGTATVNLSDGGGIQFAKDSGSNIAPFNAELQIDATVSDSDGVTYAGNPYVFGGTGTGDGVTITGGNTFYQGRIIMKNAYGSELLSLTVPMTLQYYNGNFYVTNTFDSCTSFSDPNNLSTTSDPSTLSTSATIGNFSNGVASIIMAAPSPEGTTGHVDIEVDLSATGGNLPHLQHDWPHDNNADGNYNDNPKARATFGIYKGQSDVIHIKEIYD